MIEKNQPGAPEPTDTGAAIPGAEPRPLSEVREKKLKDAARVPEARDATDAIADAAERATHPPMNR